MTLNGGILAAAIASACCWLPLLLLAFAFFPNYVGALVGNQHGDESRSVAQVVLTVEGMTCGGCEVTVERALLKVPGVVEVHVSYEEGQAVVTLDPDAPGIHQESHRCRQLDWLRRNVAAAGSGVKQ